MTIICKAKANQKFGSSLGIIQFDANGKAEINGDEKKIQALADIFGAKIEKQASKKEEKPQEIVEPKVEEKQEEKAETEDKQEEAAKEEIDFSKMSTKKLKEYAESKGIEVPSASKNEIIAALEAALNK